MTYTIQQFLNAAKEAEVSLIDAKHICDVMVKMNEVVHKSCLTCQFQSMARYESPCDRCYAGYTNYTPRHEPTTETL